MDYKLNASEWRVLQALWGHAPQTLMQLVSNLQRSTDWSASTIKTLISRMTDKGVLRFEGGRCGHARSHGILESLDVGGRIARHAALPVALVEAVGQTVVGDCVVLGGPGPEAPIG